MPDPRDDIRYTVWSYMTRDYDSPDQKPIKRNVFFYAGSTIYSGAWMGPSDCVWIVPEPFPWMRA